LGDGGVEDPERRVVGEVSEMLCLGVSTIDPQSLAWTGEGGGAGACRDKGGGLKDGVLFSPKTRLIPNRRGFAS